MDAPPAISHGPVQGAATPLVERSTQAASEAQPDCFSRQAITLSQESAQ